MCASVTLCCPCIYQHQAPAKEQPGNGPPSSDQEQQRGWLVSDAHSALRCLLQANGLLTSNSWAGYHVLLNPEYSGSTQWRFVNRAIDEVENDQARHLSQALMPAFSHRKQCYSCSLCSLLLTGQGLAMHTACLEDKNVEDESMHMKYQYANGALRARTGREIAVRRYALLVAGSSGHPRVSEQH